MFPHCRNPRARFRYFSCVVPVYFVWVESYVNSLFHFPCVPMAILVNKFGFVPKRLVSGSVGMFWDRGILSACESYIPVCSFISPAWVVLSPWCRLCHMCMVSCKLRHLACLGLRDLLVWPAGILVWCRIEIRCIFLVAVGGGGGVLRLFKCMAALR